MDHDKMLESIDSIRLHVVLALLKLLKIHEHSPYTYSHSNRVAHISFLIAKKKEIPNRDRHVLYRSALLHDIGKVGVPNDILFSEDKISDMEREIINFHPEWGENIIGFIDILSQEAKIIRHHHEKWDGSGYPDSLNGKEIPQFSRIISIADVYDALCSNRPYEMGWGHKKTYDFIADNSRTMFDPELVEVFKEIHEEIVDYYNKTGVT